MTSLDHLDLHLSACGLSLNKDLDSSLILRVTYTGCLVKQEVCHSLSVCLSPKLIVFHSSYSMLLATVKSYGVHLPGV